MTEVTYLISNLLITANRSDLAGSHIPNPKFTRKEKGEKKNFLEVVVYCLYFSKCLNISYCSRRLSHQLIHFYCEFGGKHVRYASAGKCFSFLKLCSVVLSF